jgi:hypothetical protein
MSVVDNQAGPSRSALKKEILDEIHHEERRRKLVSCIGCFTVKLIIVALPLLLMASMVAKTGLYDIPLMTQWLYEETEPTREVLPIVGYTSEQLVDRAMARAQYDAAVGVFRVELSENELTRMAQSGLQDSGNATLTEIQDFQLLVNETTGMELFFRIPRSERLVPVKSTFKPAINPETGEFALEISSLEIGALDMPAFGVEMMSNLMATQLARALAFDDGGLGELKDVGLTDDRLYLEFKPKLKLPF